MASSSFSIFFSLFLLLLTASPLPSFAAKTSDYHNQAQKLIRQLNLFPKHSVNLAFHEDESFLGSSSSSSSQIVETEFSLNVLGDPGPSLQDFAHHAGYYRLPDTKGARMFYLLFESRNKKSSDPVVVWLTGGPGCSSELALFYENGPFHLANNLSLLWNDYGWDKVSNIIFVDQPTGTGFSYTTDESDLRSNETGVSNDMYNFLQAFFKEHPQYQKNDFYITGESYAGHYIPALTARVHQGNKNKEGIHINLKGFAIGNGLTNPAIQYQAYTDYALDKNLIEKSDYDRINMLLPNCEQLIKACGTGDNNSCENAFSSCQNIFNEILDVTGNINYYDIRKKCDYSLCYDFSDMETYLNDKTVKTSLGVRDIEFVSCSTNVYYAMIDDWMQNLEVGIPALLEDGIKLLVYAGEEDLICNWLGNSRWVHAMEWSGQKAFGAASTGQFVVDGKGVGELKSNGPLAFLKVYDAGHMVPMDQPKAALQMLQSWMQGKLAEDDAFAPAPAQAPEPVGVVSPVPSMTNI